MYFKDRVKITDGIKLFDTKRKAILLCCLPKLYSHIVSILYYKVSFMCLRLAMSYTCTHTLSCWAMWTFINVFRLSIVCCERQLLINNETRI